MVIYYLLVALILIFLVVLYFDKDFFSPSAMICESYILAVLCAIYNIDLWAMSLSYKTMFVILIGILSFVGISFLVLHTRFGQKKENEETKPEANHEYRIKRLAFNMLILLQIFTALLYLYYVSKAAGGIKNFLSFEEMMNTYRESTYDDVNLLGIPSYVKQLVNISKVVAIISAYDIIVTLLKRKQRQTKDKIYKANIISIIVYSITCLLSGGRYGMIIFFLSLLLMWNLISNMLMESKRKIKIGRVLKICIIAMVLMISFSKLRYFVGRTNDADFTSYITTYFGGSIENLDLYLKNSNSKSTVFGQRTFSTIHRYLYQLGVENDYRPHAEFMRAASGVSTGNVYTGFRNYYSDFGMPGVVVLSAILAFIMTAFYKNIRKKSNHNKLDLRIIIYCLFGSGLFLHSYGDYFYSQVVSVGTILVILYSVFVKKLCINEREENDYEENRSHYLS